MTDLWGTSRRIDRSGRGVFGTNDLFRSSALTTDAVFNRDIYNESGSIFDTARTSDAIWNDRYAASMRDSFADQRALNLNPAFGGVGSSRSIWNTPVDLLGGQRGIGPSWTRPKANPFDRYEDPTAKASDRITSGINTWLQEQMPDLYSPLLPGGTAGVGGSLGNVGTGYEILDGYNDEIAAAVARVKAETGIDVPPNLVKSMLYREGGGKGYRGPSAVANLRGEQVYGFNGIFQSTAASWGIDFNRMIQDDAYAVYAMALGLSKIANYQYQGQQTLAGWGWTGVATTYFSGRPTAGFVDELGNVAGGGGPNDYVNGPNGVITLMNQWDQMSGGTGLGSASGASGLSTIWGGGNFQESQGFGRTSFSQGAGAWYYESFDPAVWGYEGGHPGRDYAMPTGTKLYSPVSGEVIVAGGTSYYYHMGRPGVAGQGDLRIRLDNGDVVLLGHMSQINVQVGQRVTAGSFVGLSGSENGDHLHLEYRQFDPTWNGNAEHHRIVDPVAALGNATPGAINHLAGVSASNFGDVLRLAREGLLQKGQPIPMSSGRPNDTRNPLLHYSIRGALGVTGGLTLTKGGAIGGPAGSNAGGGTGANPNPQEQATGNAYADLAQQYLNAPYVHGGITPSGWDCSGYTYWLGQQTGKPIPQGSHEQMNGGANVAWANLQPGDLMFFDLAGGTEYRSGNYASHVAVYIGNGRIIHAANPGVGTIISDVNDPYYTQNFLGARRY